MKRIHVFALIVCSALLLSACKIPAPGVIAQPTIDQNAVFTQAVKTVIAQMTASVTPGGGATQPIEQTPGSTSTTQATQPPAITATPSAPTPTSTPLAAASPTVPAPTATLASGDPRLALGTPTFQDTFQNGKNWAFSPDAHSDMEVQNGKVVMTAFNADYFNSWTLAWPKLTNFYLEVTGSSNTCAGLDRYGLVFRAPDATQGYLVGISCDGHYALWYWDGKEEVHLISWTSSAYIQKGAGQTNRLGIKAEGDHLSIYINGNLVGDIHDGTYTNGFFGLFIGAVQTANYTVQVSEVDYWELK